MYISTYNYASGFSIFLLISESSGVMLIVSWEECGCHCNHSNPWHSSLSYKAWHSDVLWRCQTTITCGPGLHSGHTTRHSAYDGFVLGRKSLLNFSPLKIFWTRFYVVILARLASQQCNSFENVNIENLIVSFCHFTQIKIQLEMETIKACHFLSEEIEI